MSNRKSRTTVRPEPSAQMAPPVHDTSSPVSVSAAAIGKQRAHRGSSLSRPDDSLAPVQIQLRGDTEREARAQGFRAGLTMAQLGEVAISEWIKRRGAK